MKQSWTSTQLSNDQVIGSCDGNKPWNKSPNEVCVISYFNSIYQCHVVHACRYWLKQVITLVVVMGIAWIGNVLFFNANLIFVAYIMTIFIACQGIVIFILFVPLSKQVMWIVFGQKWILMLIFRWWMPIKSGGGSKWELSRTAIKCCAASISNLHLSCLIHCQ